MHLPLAMNDQGQKTSKANLYHALDTQNAPQLLSQAIAALGQQSVDIDQPNEMPPKL